MKPVALILTLLCVCAGMAWAQAVQPAAQPEKTPVTYNPKDAPATVYVPAGQLAVNEPAMPPTLDLATTPASVNSPSMPEAVDIPSGPPSVSQPSVPANNYGPAPPSGDARLMTTPMTGNGAPTPLSNSYPGAPSGNAPSPPTCDKVCY